MEAAFIDGCSIYKCFFRIALPLAKTGIMVAGLMNFVGNWNELLIALVFVTEDAKKTLPVAPDLFCKSLCNELCTNVCGNYDCDITDNTGILSLQQSDRRRTDCRRSEGMKS